jgi:hypothetical protein
MDGQVRAMELATMKAQKSQRKLPDPKRWEAARESLKRMLEEIAPFKKGATKPVESTAGRWEEASSSSLSEEN